MLVKICGLKNSEEIDIVNHYPINYAGFIFAPSKRQITLETAKKLREQLKPEIQSVGVFVNESLENIIKYVQSGVIDRIQLHGDETLDYIQALKKAIQLPIMKAFRIKDETSLKNPLLTSPLLDDILLDTWHQANYGGTGESFNWKLLQLVPRRYFLSGGIGVENIEEALSYHPYALDINSKIETNGIKDKNKVDAIMKVITK